MNEAQIISSLVSVVCAVITTVLAWVALRKRADVAVSFTGTPVDKKDFDAHIAKYEQNNHAVWAKMEADRDKCQEEIAEIKAANASLKTSAESLKESCGLLSLRLDNLKNRL